MTTKQRKQPPANRIKMTDLWVKNWKRPGLSPPDTENGLRLYVAMNGKKSWVHFYRHPISKKLIKRTLPFMGLAEARKCISDSKYQLSQGIDPIEHVRALKQAAIAKTEGTLHVLVHGVPSKDGKTVGGYLNLVAKKLRSHDVYKRVLDRQVLPYIGHKQVHELRKSDVVAVLDRIETSSGSPAADLALAVVTAVLNWHAGRSDTFVNPVSRMKRRTNAKERMRTRKLEDHEIKAVWNAAGDPDVGVFGQIVRLLLLTGARRAEAGGLRRRSEIVTERVKNEKGQWQDIVAWKLPASRSKTKVAVLRPLSQAAIDLIDAQPVINDSDYVFTLNGLTALSLSHQRQKARIDEIAKVTDWRLHDLRRTFRSLLSRCRISLETSELLLGHAQAQIVKNYDTDILAHLPAMQDAAEQVAAEIARIVADEPKGKVIRLR
jgi:integrase